MKKCGKELSTINANKVVSKRKKSSVEFLFQQAAILFALDETQLEYGKGNFLVVCK